MITCFAHRGARGHAPENTLLAFEKAMSLGCEWVELDVRCSADGRLMVIHDDRVDRTTGGTGLVSQRDFNYLRTLDAGKGERIPTLREVLEICGGRIGINVELKVPEAADLTVALIHDYISIRRLAYEQILISSFDLRALARVRELDGRLKLGALFYGVPLQFSAQAHELGCASVHSSIEFLNKDFVEDSHRRGLKHFIYTANSAEELRRAQATGADGVFSDYPEICRDV